MGRPTHVASGPVAPATLPTVDRHDDDVAEVVKGSPTGNGSPDRPRINSPLTSARQQQQPPQRAPGTPPPTVFRSPSAASSVGRSTPHASSPQAWKCLKSSPHVGSGSDSPPTTTTVAVAAASISGPTHLLTKASADNFPERDWQLKKFLESPDEAGAGRQSMGCDDERLYNDVLDGYHSEDNIDDNDDDNGYTVAVRKP